MAQTPSPPNPPSGTPPRKQVSAVPLQQEDFQDFEGDPTNINQIPQAPPSPSPSPSRPGTMIGSGPPIVPPLAPHVAPAPQQFASGSPQLTHVGPMPALQQPGAMQGMQYGSNVPMPYTTPGM